MTLFKLPKAEDVEACLAAYAKMFSEAKKVSHPHVINVLETMFRRKPNSSMIQWTFSTELEYHYPLYNIRNFLVTDIVSVLSDAA